MQKKRPIIGLTTFRLKSERGRILDGLMPPYMHAIQAAGGIPVLIPLTLENEDIKELCQRVDGIVIPGGGDIDPVHYAGDTNGKIYGVSEDRDRVELEVARQVVQEDQPLLAICRGHQILNVALGGTLYEDVLDQMPSAEQHAYFDHPERDYTPHSVEISEGSWLAEIMGAQKERLVNSLHHQGIKDLGSQLIVSAVSPDGLVEGIEIPDHRFAVGVQWHPEEMQAKDSDMANLFRAFISACG
ncbi:MAG: putative glutamine amidotransferase [Cellvibrionaceae bacterium]|jgi:putative glutamine amidotransferase